MTDITSTTSTPSPAASRSHERAGLISFNEIWYQIFLYCLATTVLMHGFAALLAIRALHKHKFGRYFPVLLVIGGFLYPLSGGVITSCMIAWIYTAADYAMPRYFAFLYGGGQAFFLFVVSFVRLYGTL